MPKTNVGEKLKYHPFWGPPFSTKHSQDNSASKMQIDALQTTNWRGGISVHFYTKAADWRSPIPFWRVPICILEAEIVLRVLYRKEVRPKKVVTLGSRETWTSAPKTSRPRVELSRLEESARSHSS